MIRDQFGGPVVDLSVGKGKITTHEGRDEYAGGRSSLSLRFANLDAIVIIGKADKPACLAVGSHHLEV